MGVDAFAVDMRANALLKSRNGQTRWTSWNNFEHCALNGRIHGSVDKPDLAWVIDIFDFNFGWALHGADRLRQTPSMAAINSVFRSQSVE